MRFRKMGDVYVVKIFKNEELVSSLAGFLKENNIGAGSISGIGATGDVTVGFFDHETGEYRKKNFREDFEILNITGNVSMFEGEPFSHIHIMLGDKDYRVFGGHLFSAKISVTCEIYLKVAEDFIVRKFDEETGLNLLNL